MHPRGKAAGIRTASGLAGCAGVRESRHCYLADAAARGLKADSSHQPLLLPEPVGEVPLGGGRGGRQVRQSEEKARDTAIRSDSPVADSVLRRRAGTDDRSYTVSTG